MLGLLVGAVVGRPSFYVRADNPAADRALGNFFVVEYSKTDSFRWAAPQASLFLYGFQGEPAMLRLRLAAPRPSDSPPALLNLRIDKQYAASIGVTTGWRRYDIVLPTDQIHETIVMLDSKAYAAPGDIRELSMMLSSLGSFPMRISTIPVLPIRGIFLLTLPFMSWLLLKRLKAAELLAFVVGVLVALGTGWAAAHPTEAGYWLPTLGWPLWPFLPLAILLFWPQIEHARAMLKSWVIAHPGIGWSGLVLALAGLVGLRLGLPTLFGLALLVIGSWLAAVVLIQQPTLDSVLASSLHPRAIRYGLILITAVAIFLRLINLDGQPAGLWRDESRHALQALAIWEDPTYRPVYVVEGADLPALLFYLMAPVMGLFGPHAWSARLMSALAGAFTPLALFWATRPMIGRRAALAAAVLLAVSSWSLSMSRWAFPATLDHLLVLMAVGCLWRGLGIVVEQAPTEAASMSMPVPHMIERHKRFYGLFLLGLAAALGGLATYAYHTGRMAPFALALVTIIYLGRRTAAWRRALPGLILAVLVGLLIMAPLLIYVANDFEGYNRRVGTVTVFDSIEPSLRRPLDQLLQNVERYTLMWHVRGEANGRHHMPFAPMLDPIAGLLLVIGLMVVAPLVFRSRALLALLCLWLIYFIPGLFSGGAPHAMRSLGTLAPACGLAGLALAAITEPHCKYRRWIYTLPLVCALAFNTWLYFGVMSLEPRVYTSFDLVETAAGRITQQAAIHGFAVYVPAKWLHTDTILFLTHAAPAHSIPNGPIPPGPALVLLPANASADQQAAVMALLGPEAAILRDLPTFSGTNKPILIGFGRGAAASLVLHNAQP